MASTLKRDMGVRHRALGIALAIFLIIALVQGAQAAAPQVEQLKPTSPTTQSQKKENAPQVSSLLGYPRYQLHRPEWAFQFSFSPRAFSGQSLTAQQGNHPTYAYHLSIEYQPRFLQSIGVFGIGPTATLYSFPNAQVTSNFYSVSSYGGRVRYQARYFREQILVPMVSYSWEFLNYNFVNPTAGGAPIKDRVRLQGPTFGLWLLLNPLDRKSANSLYLNTGITRTYLTLEAKREQATVSQSSINNWSYFAGLRLEL